MKGFLVSSDDDHVVYINPEAICMFRVRKGTDGNFSEPFEVEIDFMGGTKTKLYGDVAKNFIAAMRKIAPI